MVETLAEKKNILSSFEEKKDDFIGQFKIPVNMPLLLSENFLFIL